MTSLALAFLAGLVAAAGFEPLSLWPLTLLAFAGLLALVETAPSLRSALARGWWFGLGNFTLGLNWIATAFTYQSAMPAWLGWIAVVLLSLYLAVYPAMAAGLAWRWGRANRLTLVLFLAAAWIVTEWLRATMFTGFAWNPIGVTLVGTPAAKLSTLYGTYGLSGTAVLLAGTLYLAARRHWTRAAAVAGAVVAGGILVHLGHSPADTRPGVALRIVQPNIGQEYKYHPDFADRNFERLHALTGGPGPEGQPRLILWPEAAVIDPLEDERRDPLARAYAANLRRAIGRSIGPDDVLLTGGVSLLSDDGLRVSGATNSVYIMDDGGRIHARYDKAHLVPYGEYLPMRRLLEPIGLSRLVPGAIDFVPGPGPRSFPLPQLGLVGFQLCYEIIFSGDVVDRANRPNFLFNPSNDAWFGAWGPPQHLAQARLRAIEEGLPVLRSTPTGISAVIDSEGRILARLGWREAGVIDARLPRPAPPTLFARVGNLLPFLFALALVAAGAAAMRRRHPIAEEGKAR
ncbi:MAG: apolipoprotein N-acyltransferase [Allosphingosinicella sp.]|uniref:apolipoprotein N-acyltransferase n=1 Tax=Allosphingosinicella sp. TaxID=2823234 RepID=UPI003929CE4C